MATPAQEVTKRQKRHYTDAEIGSALALLSANNGNVARTARELSIPRLTLREWAINRRRDSTEVREVQLVKAGTLESKFEMIAHIYSDRLTDPDVIARSSPLDAAKVAGIAVDKRQLLTGMPTAIHGSVMSEDERRLRVAELLAGIQARQERADLGDRQPAETTPPDHNPLRFPVDETVAV